MRSFLDEADESKKILHIGKCEKFLPSFIEIVKTHFNYKNHEFILTSGLGDSKVAKTISIHLTKKSYLSTFIYYITALIKMHKAEKVILHGLFDTRLVLILCLAPWLLKKSCWIIWGADLYRYQFGIKNFKWKIKEFFRKRVIGNIGHLVTYVEGDVALARKWYGARGKYIECLMYPSNLYNDYNTEKPNNKSVNIQVGNSADPTNNHIEALEKLLPFRNDNICIFVPLSYGSPEYAQQVITHGKKWFGDKFKPLTDFMPFVDYLSFLASVDIAIFNHKRQQAMGNTITLLGLGKTVYIRKDTTQWQFFIDKGIKVNDIEQLTCLNFLKGNENIDIIKGYFSMSNYIEQLKSLFK